MGQEKPGAQDAPLSFESLAEIFPHLGYTVLQDVVEQCDNNHAAALERLLAMSADASEGPQPSPAAAVPRAHQTTLASLQSSRGSSLDWQQPPPPPVPPPPPDPRPAGPPALGAAGGHAPAEAAAEAKEPEPSLMSMLPHLARLLASPVQWLDPSIDADALVDGLDASPQSDASQADAWQPDAYVSQHEASQHGAGQPNAAQPDAAGHAAFRQADASRPSAAQPSAVQPGAVDRAAVRQADPARLDEGHHNAALPGSARPDVAAHAVLRQADAARPDAAAQPSAAQQGYAPEELLLAVDFHADMFPDLRREVVADVLQRHSEAPQVALDQLMMLSAAVAEAAAGPSHGGSPTASVGDFEGGGGTGAAAVPDARSWNAAAADLLDEDGGDASGGSLVPLPPGASWEGSGGPHAGDWRGAEAGMGAEEKLQLLAAEFGSLPAGDVSAALAACDGSLLAAAQLLRAVTADEEEEKGAKGSAAPGGTAAAGTAAVAEKVHSGPAGAAPAGLEQLARSFPTASREALEVALVGCSGDLSATLRTLREAGYAEVAQQDGLSGAGGSPGAAEPLAPLLLPGTRPPPPPPTSCLPLPLGEATYRRNQAIFQEERAVQQHLQQCYRRCFQTATAAYKRGDKATANEQRARGQEYRRQYEEERRRASRRIGKRVNAGTLPLITVDLHGKYVDEALELVEAGIRSLPESIPGGVVVRYITGKGLHSAGGAPRIKPQVLRLLAERGLPHEDRGGFVEVTLAPSAA